MPIIVVGKMQVRRGLQSELPGAPLNLSPLQFGPGLDIGEFGMTTDTSRLLVGHNPGTGQPNYQRTVFPYQNIEVLTEFSPRVQELFNQFLRNTNQESFYPCSVIASGGASTDVMIIPYDGALPTPLSFYAGTNGRAEYMVFTLDTNSIPTPLRQGTLTIINGSTPSIDDDFAMLDTDITNTAGYEAISFNMSAQQGDSINGFFYNLMIQNTTGDNVALLIRVTQTSNPLGVGDN